MQKLRRMKGKRQHTRSIFDENHTLRWCACDENFPNAPQITQKLPLGMANRPMARQDDRTWKMTLNKWQNQRFGLNLYAILRVTHSAISTILTWRKRISKPQNSIALLPPCATRPIWRHDDLTCPKYVTLQVKCVNQLKSVCNFTIFALGIFS